VNSDPKRSNGALLQYTPLQFIRKLDKLINGEFLIEDWQRLDIYINGKFKNTASCEVFVGEKDRQAMSHHKVYVDNKIEEQKGSGLLLVTGSGSTGWYDSAIRYLIETGNKFKKTLKQMAVLLTEPAYGKLNWSKLKHLLLGSEKTIKIKSLNSEDGIVSIDSLKSLTFKFSRGDLLEAKISDYPLKVIRSID
jgi:NAD kinase